MAEFSKNIWAPWRMAYIRSLHEEDKHAGCFLCNYWASLEKDKENHVVWRTESAFVLMNRFPYTNGHLLIALARHEADFSNLSNEEMLQLTTLQRDGVELLRRTIKPDGFNIGYNMGRCAGAGLPDHLHAHVVPRWSGDTNFMPILTDTRVIPDALEALHNRLATAACELGFGQV